MVKITAQMMTENLQEVLVYLFTINFSLTILPIFLVVIIRYYGGTKLGVSGLVKPQESTKYTLEHAEIITKELETELKIQFKFSQQNIIFLFSINLMQKS